LLSLLLPALVSGGAHLGFYTCVTPQVGNQCEEGFTLDQAGIATIAFSSNATRIRQAHGKNGKK
jgi:hypothetical protein